MTEERLFPPGNKELIYVGPALNFALRRLYANWDKPGVGITAVTLIDENNYYHPATSRWSEEERRIIPAEEGALTNYQIMFGRDPGPGSIMVSTLSPALRTPLPQQATTDFLLKHGIKIIHYGHLDPTQAENGFYYEEAGFTKARLTGDRTGRLACANLYNLFGEYQELMANDPTLAGIKAMVGKKPFDDFIEVMKIG